VIHKQQLLAPLLLETSAADEAVIENNLDIFEANGFNIQVDANAAPGERIKLLSLPYSKNTTFDQTDVLELASLLNESSEVDVSKVTLKNSSIHGGIKCPKLMSMFASRACRSAVMIGTALTQVEMSSIICNLTSIDQPWNCPHGRPTLRHLEDMKNIRRDKLRNTQNILACSQEL
jgi:DNA mismatch repair protein PMS2